MGLFDNYPLHWNSIRRQVYLRDSWTCQKCGKTHVKLFAHHKKHLAQGGSNNMDNLETLCRSCHEKKHPHLWWRRIMFWLKVYFGATFLIVSIVVFLAVIR